MNITINIVECASNLTHNETCRELIQTIGEHLYDNEDDLFYTNETGDQHYKEEVQDVYNRHYDYFYDEILKCKIN